MDELKWFAEYVNNKNNKAYAELKENITLPNYGENNWEPIKEYKGVFDGKGHTISKVFCERFNQDYAGLFGINNGKIINVGIIDSYFSGKYYIGSFCGCNNGIIENCYSSSTYNGDENDGGVIGVCYVGGVCGVNNGTIKYCYNSGKVEASEDYVGGLCGYNQEQGKITSCFSTGIIIYNKENAVNYGSFCGCNKDNSQINNCYTSAKVQEINDYYGKESKGVFNCNNTNYYLCNEDNGGKTNQQFLSGEVAYLLGLNDEIWGQDLSVENSLPCLNCDKKVYKVKCVDDDAYSNQDQNYEKPEYENGFCKHCGAYQEANLNNDNYYEIYNAGNLYWFAQYVNKGGENLKANAILMNDIVVNKNVLNKYGDLNGNGYYFITWKTIGYYATYKSYDYNGIFDGNKKTISGLYINNYYCPRKQFFDL